ncbi:MAG: acetyl-CoA carboxylase biotin carboxyl carrier protein [Planctomycetota bacterium]|nr:acetyl-CoA carboxylase biotin carboxyl carrier protein [Planctomycetota bacterium]
MIDIRKLKELVRLMVNNNLSELDLRDSEEQVTLRRNGPSGAPQLVAPVAAPVQAAPTPGTSAAATPPSAHDASSSIEGMHKIESPMVGTCYTAPDPDSPVFVKVGDRVDPDKVVCLIEAMKIFNEIKAECTGTVEKVMVNNAEAIEFGQALFIVKPD